MSGHLIEVVVWTGLTVTIDLSNLCQSVVKYLKELFLVQFFNLLKKINCLKWLLGLKNLRASKKVKTLQVVPFLQVASWKNIISYHGGKKQHFFLIVTMKLPSTVLSYLNAYSPLNFARTFLYFKTLIQIKHQRSVIWIS